MPAVVATRVSAQAAWTFWLDAVTRAHPPLGQQQLAVASDKLLALLDRLSDACQHRMQALMG